MSNPIKVSKSPKKASDKNAKPLNKGEFASLMAAQFDCSKSEAEKTINMFVDSMINLFKSGQELTLVGFGSFSIKERAERDGVNPKTGQKMRISSSRQPSFKAGKNLKDALTAQ